MFSLKELKAGDFIDLENYFKEMVILADEDSESETLAKTIVKFFNLLNGKMPTNQKEYDEIIKEFITQLTEIKETYIWIYNPPQLPTSSQQHNPTFADEFKKEFAEDYGGYIEIIYVLCKGNLLEVNKVLELKTVDFLFWGEYALRKRLIESLK